MCKSGHTCVTPGLYAMVGAAAMLGGATRMTGRWQHLTLESVGEPLRLSRGVLQQDFVFDRIFWTEDSLSPMLH